MTQKRLGKSSVSWRETNNNGSDRSNHRTDHLKTPDPENGPIDRTEGSPVAIRILIADDHPITREGLITIIHRQPGMTVVSEVADGLQAIDAFDQVAPDVGLIDLRMPGLDGVGVIEAIRNRDPTARLIILTSYAVEEDIYRALRAGARGYLLKDMTVEEILDCVRLVLNGQICVPPAIAGKLAERVTSVELTAREREVLALIAKGQGNREIGLNLSVTEGTVKVHVNNILSKLGVASRTEAVTLALRRGLVRLDQ